MSVFDDELFKTIEAQPLEELLADIKELIAGAASRAPRSLQRALGPSEVGHPCPRKLALGMRGARGGNRHGDPLASIIGTATHSWLDKAVNLANENLGRERWIAEARVTIREGLSGTCDLYDRDTCSVLDWKVPGTTRFKLYTTKGPGPVYRAQVHLYGQGYLNEGLPVEHVGIVFLPRAGTLRNARIWREPYNQDVVDEVLEKLDDTLALMDGLDVLNKPAHFKLIPIVPTEDCRLCPYWVPPGEDSSGPYQCDGVKG